MKKIFRIFIFTFLLIIILPCVVFARENTPSLSFSMKISTSSCQLSIWIERISDSFMQTICVTYTTAKLGLGNTRPSVLPVWAHSLKIDYGDGNIYPTYKNPLPDAITAASPPKGEFTRSWEPSDSLESGDYYFYIEINKSFDNDQPSVVWRGTISIGENNSSAIASIIGHGSETGEDGNINTDTSSLTTALNLLSDVRVEYTAPTIADIPPEILTQSLPDAYAGIIYNKKIDIADAGNNDVLLFELIESPDWLSINESGILSGIPDDSYIAADIRVVLIVRNQSGLADTLITELNVVKNILYVNSKPDNFRLYNPYPNPFNKNILFKYEIRTDCNVKLIIYDILGREIVHLQDGFKNKGIYLSHWNGLNPQNNIMASGIYYYTFSAGDYFNSGKILFLK